MSADTKIQWTDHTASPWHSCSHATYTDADGNEREHPGCLRCYAEAGAKRNPATLGVWGKDGTRVRSASFWDNCRRWNRQAQKEGVRRRVFFSICDPFESWDGPISDAKGNWLLQCDSCINPDGTYYREIVPPFNRSAKYYTHGCGEFCRLLTMDDLRRDLFALIDECLWLDFLMLTKRPQNIKPMWPLSRAGKEDLENGNPTIGPNAERNMLYRPNVWLLTSISDQATADAMIPHLLACRDLVPVLGVSAEPLLGEIRLSGPGCQACYGEGSVYPGEHVPCRFCLPLDWLIIGGESGRNARPCDLAWIRSLISQCKGAGVACFVKQLGSNPVHGPNTAFPHVDGDVTRPKTTGNGFGVYSVQLRDSKGGDPSEWPEDLRVREMPQKASVMA